MASFAFSLYASHLSTRIHTAAILSPRVTDRHRISKAMLRLYPLYARDVLSFLNFAQLQECRLVSRSINATILNHPVSIPARRHLSELSISVLSAERYNSPPKICEDGYVETQDGGSDEGRSWKRIQAEWGCCREELEIYVQESAQVLVGERVLVSHPANSIVEIWITAFNDSVVFWARNEMTAATSLGILHLLEHLRHTYVITHYSDGAGSTNSPTLNPSILRLLQGRDGRGACYKLHVGLYCSSPVPTTINELMAGLTHLKAGVLSCPGENLAMALDFALRGKPHCRQIMLGYQRNEAFDAVLQHYRMTVTRIGRNAVSELVLPRYIRVDFWPADLPPLKEMEKIGNRLYRLPGGMINVHSGERFDVVVHIEWLKRRGLKRLAEMRLLFR